MDSCNTVLLILLLLLCSVLWKQFLTTGQITPLVSRLLLLLLLLLLLSLLYFFRLLQRLRLSPKKQVSVLRIMIDYIVYTCPSPSLPSNPEFNQVISCLDSLVWKYFLYPLDRLLLCIVRRFFVCLKICTCIK